MIASVLMLPLAMLTMQASDTTRAPRVAYTRCLRTFVDRSQNERMAQAAFDAAFPQQCPQQLGAYRSAIMARESALRATRANAEETANLEIEDSQVNFHDLFVAADPAAGAAPGAAPAAQPAVASAASATPPATPAAATTTSAGQPQ